MEVDELACEAGRIIESDDRIKKVLISRHPDDPERNVMIRAVLWKQQGWEDNLIIWMSIDGRLLDSPEFLTEYIIREADVQVYEGLVGQNGQAYYQII